MSDFEQRLKRAIERGTARGALKAHQLRQTALSEEELKSLHGRYRLQLSEHIEQCLKQFVDHVPGFRYETVFGQRGWGAAASRDDLQARRGGRRENVFSRLEITVRPCSPLFVLELAGKGTVRNKEVFNRSYFDRLQEADPARFLELVDAWVVEYAERFTANG
jgi:hypothetical protein